MLMQQTADDLKKLMEILPQLKELVAKNQCLVPIIVSELKSLKLWSETPNRPMPIKRDALNRIIKCFSERSTLRVTDIVEMTGLTRTTVLRYLTNDRRFSAIVQGTPKPNLWTMNDDNSFKYKRAKRTLSDERAMSIIEWFINHDCKPFTVYDLDEQSNNYQVMRSKPFLFLSLGNLSGEHNRKSWTVTDAGIEWYKRTTGMLSQDSVINIDYAKTSESAD